MKKAGVDSASEAFTRRKMNAVRERLGADSIADLQQKLAGVDDIAGLKVKLPGEDAHTVAAIAADDDATGGKQRLYCRAWREGHRHG